MHADGRYDWGPVVVLHHELDSSTNAKFCPTFMSEIIVVIKKTSFCYPDVDRAGSDCVSSRCCAMTSREVGFPRHDVFVQ